MSHGLTKFDEMWYFGEVPWHKLGIEMSRRHTPAECAGMIPWITELVEMFRYVDGNAVAIEEYRAVVRSDTKHQIGVVGKGFQPVHNDTIALALEEVVGDTQCIETFGSLWGGQRVWFMANLGEFSVAGTDLHKQYLLATTAHDGSGRFQMFPTTVRVVCQNTLRAAQATDGVGGFAVKHTKNVALRIKAGADHLKSALGWFDAYREQCERLAMARVTPEESRELLATLLNANSTRGKNQIEEVIELATTGAGNAAFAGTAYALFQGVTDYVDHARGTRIAEGQNREEARFASTMFGSGADLKLTALDAITTLLDKRVSVSA